MQQLRKEELFWSVYRDMYIQRLQVHNKNEMYVGNVRRTLERFTHYCNLVGRRLADIGDHDLELYLKQRKTDVWRDRPLSNVTLNNELGYICTCLAKAGPKESKGQGRSNYGFIEEVPYIEPLAVDATDPAIVTDEQIKRFIEATHQATTPKLEGCTPAEFWQAAILLAMVTGLRRRGLLLIQRPSDEMLLEQRELYLPGSFHKTRNSLRIPLGSDDVVQILAKLPSRPGEPLLPWRNERTGKPLRPRYFTKIIAQIQDDAGIAEEQRLKLKSLRATAATVIAENISDDVASKRLGHAPGSKTLLTNYKAKRISKVDVEASELLGQMVLPHVAAAPQLRVFTERA